MTDDLEKVGSNKNEICDKAEADFQRFADAWDLLTDEEFMSPEDRESFGVQKGRVLRELIRGNAEVNSDGDIVYRLKYPTGSVTHLTFARAMGHAYMDMDNFKDQHSIKKLLSFLGVVTRQPVKFLGSLDMVDTKFTIAIGTLFLGS